MRRSELEITDREEIISVIKKCMVCRLALSDEGKPYALPLNFGFAQIGGKSVFYFHSAKSGRKLDIIRRNPLACAVMDCSHELVAKGGDACGYSYHYDCVIAEGRAEIVEDSAEKLFALEAIMLHQTGRCFTFKSGDENSVAIIKFTAETVSCKRH